MVCQFLCCPLSQDLDEMCVYIGGVIEVLMQFRVTITETNVSTVCFETEEEAREFMNEPDYDLCDWECIESKIAYSFYPITFESN